MKKQFHGTLGVLAAVGMQSLLGQPSQGDPNPSSATVAKPNIVFVLLDDLRSDDLSCTGNSAVKTPNIDRIGREGALFRNAFVTTPLCIPSRASFLTGQYPHTNGIKAADSKNDARSHGLVTFPLLLQRAGYETALIGKWHIGNSAEPRPGFSKWISFEGQGVYVDPEINIDGKSEKKRGYITDILNDYAVDFIRRPHTKPFMLFLAHKAVHAPNISAQQHRGLFADHQILPPSSVHDNWNGKPVLQRPGIVLDPNDTDTRTTEENIRDRWRCLMSVDDGMKKIYDALVATQQLDNTIIVFTSDNGYFYGEHGLGGKHGPYEEAIRVPLLVRYPAKAKAGTTIDSFALSIDLAPTMLELAGLTPPHSMQGRSWLPRLQADPRGARSSFLAEFFVGQGADVTVRFPEWQAVRSSRWKYVRYTDMAALDELYDLQTDPHEMRNLVSDANSKEQLKAMKAELSRLLEESR